MFNPTQLNNSTKRLLKDINSVFIYGERPKKLKSRPEGFPKRAQTPFLYFLQERRDDFAKKHAKLSHKEVVCELGIEWNRLLRPLREKFEDLARKDRKRYQREKRAFYVAKYGVAGVHSEKFFYLEGIIKNQFKKKKKRMKKIFI